MTASIEAVFRAERARVLASTIRVTNGDFDLAEEMVQEAFAAATEAWAAGVPDEPRGWLVQVARNKAIDTIRRRVRLRAIVASELRDDEPTATVDTAAVTDDRLRLIFTCCHPALAPEAQVALTLRTLGGLTTDEIARAFLTSPATMAQRLVRAKTKIREARIPYEVPEASELGARAEAVMAVVYLVFNEGYAATAGDDLVRRDLCHEAIRQARLVVELTASDRPELAAANAEAAGLLALMLCHDARRATRTDAAGDLVLLEDQDRARWDRAQIDEALALVPRGLRRRGGPGPYALQAAIAALHASAPTSSATDWPQIAALFGELERRYPSAIVALNRAVAIAMVDGPAAGLAHLEPLADELGDYHLWHAARADLLRRLDRAADAADAYRAALARVGSAPERRFLTRRLATVTADD
ncbi:MAG: sigma-70 family RNA polymerase sigma factor [Myxococcales bacterium]|nr:sigma-70 family RNA polymerase sigma factor [Myxococcales bacterium]